MIPFLLPVALVIFALGGVTLLMLVLGYHVVRRDSALVVARGTAAPRILFSGSAFALPGMASVQSIDLSPRNYASEREIVTDGASPVRVEIALELAVRSAPEAVLQIREMLGEKASDFTAVERFAFDRVDAAVAAAAVPGISFDEFAAEAEASIKSALPAFRVEALRITRAAS